MIFHKLRSFAIALLLIYIPTKQASTIPSVSWPTITIATSLSVLAGSILTNIVANKTEKACQELSLIIYFLRSNAKNEDELFTQLDLLPKNLLLRIKNSLSTDDGSGERAMTNEEIAAILYHLSNRTINPNFQLEQWLARDQNISNIAAHTSLVTAAIAALVTGFTFKSIFYNN